MFFPFLAVVLLAAAWLLQADPARAEDADTWKIILQRNADELQNLSTSLQTMSSRLPEDLTSIRTINVDSEKRYERLKVQESLTGANPWEVRSILRGLSILNETMTRGLKRFRDTDGYLQRQEDHLTSEEKDFKEQINDTMTAEIEDTLNTHLKNLQDVRKTLQTVKKRLETGLSPAQAMGERLEKMRARLEGDLPKTLNNFFFHASASVFSPYAWSSFHRASGRWIQSVTLTTSSIDKGDLLIGLGNVGRLVLYGLLLCTAVVVGARVGIRRFPEFGIPVPPAMPLARVMAWSCFALSCFIVSYGLEAARFDILSALGQALAATGLVVMAWKLRLLGLPSEQRQEKSKGNLLLPLCLLFSLGVFAQVMSVPAQTLMPIWPVILILTTWWLARRLKKYPTMDLERNLTKAACGILPVLALMALMGWAQLAVLLTSAWLLLAGSAQLGVGISRMLNKWQIDEDASEMHALLQGIVYGLGFPMIFLSLLSLTVVWLSMHLGGVALVAQISGLEVGWGEISLNLFRLILIFILFFVTRSSVYVAHSVLRQIPSRWPEFDRGTVDSLQTVSTYLLWVLFILAALYLLGVNFTSLAVIAGGLSVGIGFGLQNIVNNFVAGLIILFGRSVRAGDVIQLGTLSGVVRTVQIRNTIVQTAENATIFVPNSDLITQQLVNWSHRDATVRKEIMVGVAYGSDTTKVRDLLVKAALSHPHVLVERAPSVIFKDFGASSLDFVLQFWVDDVNNALGATSDIRFEIERIFRENDIEIAFPQQELTLRSAPALEKLLALKLGVGQADAVEGK